jgi:hypothetical protein
MPSLTPSDAVILGLIAKRSAGHRKTGTPGKISLDELVKRLTEPAQPLGKALVDSRERGVLPDINSPEINEAVKFLRRWGGQQAT